MKHFPLLHRLALLAIGAGFVVACHNSTASASLAPADAQSPAASICAPIATAVVSIIMTPDVPSPRCAQVTAGQYLQLVNQTSTPVDVRLAQFSFTLAPGAMQTINAAFGTYLAPGVHRISMSAYAGGSGAELWLQAP